MTALCVAPNPENASLAELSQAARCAPSQRTDNRCRAMIALIEGIPQAAVGKIFGVSVRTVRRWVKAFNAAGIEGLIERAHPGRPRKLHGAQASLCVQLLEHPEQAGQTHWTGVKFHGYLCRALQVEVGYSTVLRFLHEQNFSWQVPQPWPDRQDAQQRQAFQQRLGQLAGDPAVELWFADECGVEGDPRPRRRWARKGAQTRVTRNGDHLRLNVTGMICPRTGEAYLLEFSHNDTEVFQAFLDEANKDLDLQRRQQFLIIDNAAWHKSRSLRWGRFQPLFLPPYSPDYNPIEKLWLVMKTEWFADFVAKSRAHLTQRLDQALNWLMQRQDKNRITCAMRT